MNVGQVVYKTLFACFVGVREQQTVNPYTEPTTHPVRNLLARLFVIGDFEKHPHPILAVVCESDSLTLYG